MFAYCEELLVTRQLTSSTNNGASRQKKDEGGGGKGGGGRGGSEGRIRADYSDHFRQICYLRKSGYGPTDGLTDGQSLL